MLEGYWAALWDLIVIALLPELTYLVLGVLVLPAAVLGLLCVLIHLGRTRRQARQAGQPKRGKKSCPCRTPTKR